MNCEVYDRLWSDFIERNREHIAAAERKRITARPSEEYEKARADERMALRRERNALRRANSHVAEHRCNTSN
jgi:deoxyribodipyrimidine photolyase-like uncharacterized protein